MSIYNVSVATNTNVSDQTHHPQGIIATIRCCKSSQIMHRTGYNFATGRCTLIIDKDSHILTQYVAECLNMHWTNHTHLLRVLPAMIHHCKTQTHSIIYILSGLHPQMSRRCRPKHAPVLSPPLQIHARNNIKSPLRASPAPVCRCRRKHAPDQS